MISTQDSDRSVPLHIVCHCAGDPAGRSTRCVAVGEPGIRLRARRSTHMAKVRSDPSKNVGYRKSTSVDRFPPVEIRNDWGIMLKAYQLDRSAFGAFDATRWNDCSFGVYMLERYAPFFFDLPSDAQNCFREQLMEPPLAGKPFRRASLNGRRLAERVNSELWGHRRFVEAWFKAGLPFVARLLFTRSRVLPFCCGSPLSKTASFS